MSFAYAKFEWPYFTTRAWHEPGKRYTALLALPAHSHCNDKGNGFPIRQHVWWVPWERVSAFKEPSTSTRLARPLPSRCKHAKRPSISDTRPRRTLVLTAIKICKQFRSRRQDSGALFWARKLCEDIIHTATMQFVALNTSPRARILLRLRARRYHHYLVESSEGKDVGLGQITPKIESGSICQDCSRTRWTKCGWFHALRRFQWHILHGEAYIMAGFQSPPRIPTTLDRSRPSQNLIATYI